MTNFSLETFSTVTSIGDLDDFVLECNSDYPMPTIYTVADPDEFGFDPPTKQGLPSSRADQIFNSQATGHWQDSTTTENEVHGTSQSLLQYLLNNYETDQVTSGGLANYTTCISRFDEVTPPRTDFEVPEDLSKIAEFPRTLGRKKTKTWPVDSALSIVKGNPGRKRKYNKNSGVNTEQETSWKESIRKVMLEKNRLAAAKCRINKKEMTEQLQRDCQEKGQDNALLKHQITRMKTKLQCVHAILLTHANCTGCKLPGEIHKYVANMSQECMVNQVDAVKFDDFLQMETDSLPQSAMTESYFSSMSP